MRWRGEGDAARESSSARARRDAQDESSLATAAPSPAAREPSMAVQGSVRDWNGAPAGGARVFVEIERASGEARELATVVSDGAGRFSISGAPLGRLRVQACAKGFAPSWVLDVENDGRRTIDWLELALRCGARMGFLTRDERSRSRGAPCSGRSARR